MHACELGGGEDFVQRCVLSEQLARCYWANSWTTDDIIRSVACRSTVNGCKLELCTNERQVVTELRRVNSVMLEHCILVPDREALFVWPEQFHAFVDQLNEILHKTTMTLTTANTLTNLVIGSDVRAVEAAGRGLRGQTANDVIGLKTRTANGVEAQRAVKTLNL